MNVALTILSLVALVFPFFFWGRGIIKSRRDDIIFGFSIFAFIFVASLALSGSSAVFSQMGILILLFGIETLIVSKFAKEDCPLKKRDRIGLGLAAILVGGFFSMIV